MLILSDLGPWSCASGYARYCVCDAFDGAAGDYMALSAQEQFQYTLKLAKMPTRNVVFAQADAAAALRGGELCRILV